MKNCNRQFCNECSLKNRSKKFIVDLTGQKFGKLTVIEMLPERWHKHTVYRCRCECNRVIEVERGSLVSGLTTSCGICMKSKGEYKISQVLEKIKIKYFSQYSFEQCRSKAGAKLKFDFYLPDYNICIEYDGEQHFSYTNSGWRTEENFLLLKENDEIKNQYCRDNKIGLIRIPYTDYKHIDAEYMANLLKER